MVSKKLVSFFGIGVVCAVCVGGAAVGETSRVVDVDVGCQRIGGVECPTVAAVVHGRMATTTRKEEDRRTFGDDFNLEFTTAEAEGEEGESQEEENLVPPLPPSSKRRRWGLSFALVSLIGLGCLLWTYRHSLPTHRLPHINYSLPFTLPHLSLSMPTISSSSFTLRKPTFGGPSPDKQTSPRFRPDSSSLLRWAEEEDPSSTSRTSHTHSSSWRSKLPRIPRVGRYNRGSGPTSTGRSGLFQLGDLEDEGEYEEVGLLPSPSPYLNTRSERMMSYGTV